MLCFWRFFCVSFSRERTFERIERNFKTQNPTPSPPSRPRSHAPWIYPSDIQIDPSSLEVSPKLSHAEFPNGDIDIDNDEVDIVESVDPLEDLRMPSVGPSPSVFSSDALSSR